jgi:hypothetical protein
MKHLALVLLAWALCLEARADELLLDASQGAPRIEVTINARPVRLVVDTTLPALAILTPDAARRLGVRPIPLASGQMELDGDVVLRGRIGRPEIVFANGRRRRTIVALLRADDLQADGLIGPGALAYDHLRVVLNADAAPGRRRAIRLQTASRWLWDESIGGRSTLTTIDLGRRESLMSRRLSQRLVEEGVLLPEGGVRRTTFRLGIGMNVQALRLRAPAPDVTLGEIIGHTDDVLFPPPALEEEVIVVEAHGRPSLGPALYLGRSALSGCSDISYDLGAGQLTLAC